MKKRHTPRQPITPSPAEATLRVLKTELKMEFSKPKVDQDRRQRFIGMKLSKLVKDPRSYDKIEELQNSINRAKRNLK